MLALCAFLHRFKYDEIALTVLIQFQNRSLIVHPVAVVGSRPHSYQLLIEPVYISLLH